MNSTAIVVMMFLCSDGSFAKFDNDNINKICDDKSSPNETKVFILNKYDNYESLLVIERNDKRLLTLFLDGKIEKDPSFTVDDASLTFWRGIALTYRQACPAIVDAVPNTKEIRGK